MDSVENFAFGYSLAAADNSAVCAVLLNKSLALFCVHVTETHGSGSAGNEVRFLADFAHVLQNHVADIETDSGSGGEAGGFDAGNIYELRVLLTGSDDEIVAGAVGADTCE